MDETINVNFLGYFIREINFTRNDYYKGDKINLDLKITKNCTYLENNKARLNIRVILFDDAVNKNYPFSLSFIISGLYQYPKVNIELDENRDLLERKMFDIIYPYIRSVASNTIMNANLPPIFLPTINVIKFVQKDENIN